MNKIITTDEYLPSVIIIIEKEKFLFCKTTIFNLLVVIIVLMKTKKERK